MQQGNGDRDDRVGPPLGPTLERMRRDEFREVPSPVKARAGETVMQAVTQDTLDRYYARGELAPGDRAENARRYEAGRQLREAWSKSGLEARLTGSYTPAVSGGADADTRMVEAVAGSRAYSRMIGLVGAHWSPVFVCCCLGEPVGKGVTMTRLRQGLAKLADALRI